MKTSLEYLPEAKQREILEIVKIIKESVDSEKIILFGSYATGNWVEDKYISEGILYEYISDYDFLIITKEDYEKEYVLTEKILARCNDRYKVPVSPIIHSIDFVNEGLEKGQYFFTEIIKDGILLFDKGNTTFTKAKELSIQEQKQIAQDYYDVWYKRGSNFLRFTKLSFEDLKKRNELLNDAAFLLHQTAERFYNCIALVINGYKPKTHNLDKLRHYIKPFCHEVAMIFPFPTDDKKEKHFFDLIKRAYIEARYSKSYVITEEELSALINRVEFMESVVQQKCNQWIESLK